MISSVRLWHITPADLGTEFLDPTETLLEINSELYDFVNSDRPIDKKCYSKTDYASLIKMRNFLSKVKEAIADTEIQISPNYPNVANCIAQFKLKDEIYCYMMVSGIVVFLDLGSPVPFDDANYFSIEVFCERQQYEYDYCYNCDNSERKQVVYDFLDILWDCIDDKEYPFSSAKNFGNHGIRYTLCIYVIDDPDMVSNDVQTQFKRNIRALLDTSALNNILDDFDRDAIQKYIDNDPINDIQILELSENLIFADHWSGVVIAGNITPHNEVVLRRFIEFEIWLQSNWLLFDAYCENIGKRQMSAIELQGILNRVEMIKVQLENDISSNMEPGQLKMRQALVLSSGINTIYQRMYGMTSNKLKMVLMNNEKTKTKYAILSDISLSIIALLQVYGVINSLIAKESFSRGDITTIFIMLAITIVCVWIMIKSRK